MSCQGFLRINGRLRNGVQVVGDDAPADGLRGLTGLEPEGAKTLYTCVAI